MILCIINETFSFGKVFQTPFGQKAEIEFYSRLDALKKLADLGQMTIPQQDLENERIKTVFNNMIRDYSRDHGQAIDEVRDSFLKFYETKRPDYFDTLVRLGITSAAETAT